MTGTIVERYLKLGLRLDRHVEGTVDAYFGPSALSGEVSREPVIAPASLAAEARQLLDELDDGWLRDQVVGLRTFAGVLAEEPGSYEDEVEGCYGVRPSHTDESVFAEAHERLDSLLPGSGTLASRHAEWEETIHVPAPVVESVLARIIAEARRLTVDLIDLPPGEEMELEPVHDVPWLGFNQYLGDLRGRISVNLDMPQSAMQLVHLAIHETYPGHQAERSLKDHLLVRGRGLLEESIVLGPTPQSLFTEGIAEIAPEILLEGPNVASFEAILRDAGVRVDLAHAVAVEDALKPCRWAEVNAALMLHATGAAAEEVHAYLMRWGLMGAPLADHLIRFMNEPTSRSYMIAYPAGRDLCRAYVGGNMDRFRKLLTDQVRVIDLLA